MLDSPLPLIMSSMPGKILVAEDDPEARELLTVLLAGSEYRVLEAADGIEALELLRAERPDLLITDIVMPRMDGYELVRRLRQDHRTAATPVIFCSATYHEREVSEMARSLGVRSTLAKPYDPGTVRPVVAAALSKRAPQPPAESPEVRTSSSAQERLSALVAFTRQLFSETDPGAIVEATCHAARDILLAQVAHLVIHDGKEPRRRYSASGLEPNELEQLLAARMYRDLLQSVEAGGCASYPMSSLAALHPLGTVARPGEFVSMIGVPIASSSRRYGYLCVLNRLGLPAFTREDTAVARTIASQLAVAYENARRYQVLREEVARRGEMEREVRSLNLELERRVAERTGELEIANRELEAFSYSVAHDLRAPLRLIHAHAQMLRDYNGPPGAREPQIHMEQIQRGAREMSALIDGLLALARVSHVEMKREPTPLGELLARILERLRHEAQQRDIEWRLAPLPTLPCDPDLMHQVFINLIDNALKYSRPRPRALIEIGTGEDEGERYIFVRDNGVGFDMRYARKLFGVFQRLHRQDEFEGTGIGLATVSRIVERHGGRIWADSQVGRGTEFRFTLAGL